jgi:small multidrug resistance family-3 protein
MPLPGLFLWWRRCSKSGGDAVIRHGLRGHKLAVVLAGFVPLGCYGLLVNSLKWDFQNCWASMSDSLR